MFDRIVGHGDVLSLIRKMLIDGSSKGVFLFHGPKSVGKHTVAREFARLSVCSGTMDSGCSCDNCRLFPSIPDYLSVDDSQKIIKVEDAKSVDQFLSLAPYSARVRAVVIDDAERMNRQASYSLLKTLEDCGSKASVVLVTSHDSDMPPAILSRCVPVQFGPLSQAEVSDVLSMQGHPRTSVEDVCRASPYFSGSVLRDFAVYSKYQRKMPSLLKALASGEEEALLVSSEASESGHAVHFMETLVSALCDVVKTHYDRPGDIACLSCSAEVESLTETWPADVCIASCARIGDVLDSVRSPLNLKVGPRLQTALSWMSMYASQAAVRKRMSG
jgi:DNA polymerase-3 subunit delta'